MKFIINEEIRNNYNLAKYLPYLKESGYSIMDTVLIQKLKKLPVQEVVTVTDSCRLDVVSDDKYGTTELYWVVALYNDINDPESVVEGMEIKLPSSIDLGTLFLSLIEEKRK